MNYANEGIRIEKRLVSETRVLRAGRRKGETSVRLEPRWIVIAGGVDQATLRRLHQAKTVVRELEMGYRSLRRR